MALFRKKENLDIPTIPSLPEFPSEPKERELPALPKGFNEDINRNIIKSAIGDDFESKDDSSIGEGSIPSPPEPDLEHERFLPREKIIPPIMESEVKRVENNTMEGPDSIFVRIDKFKAAKKELAGIKKNLLETEAIINKIREIKVKEDSEVNEINLNLDNIKRKINDVDSLVFDKI